MSLLQSVQVIVDEPRYQLLHLFKRLDKRVGTHRKFIFKGIVSVLIGFVYLANEHSSPCQCLR